MMHYLYLECKRPERHRRDAQTVSFSRGLIVVKHTRTRYRSPPLAVTITKTGDVVDQSLVPSPMSMVRIVEVMDQRELRV